MRLLTLSVAVLILVFPAEAAADEITLDGPGATTRGHQVTFAGRLTPPAHRTEVGIYLGSSVVARALTNPDGTFIARPNLFTEGDYRARTRSAVSPRHHVDIVGSEARSPASDTRERNLAAHPLESVSLAGPGATTRGHQVTFRGRIRPAAHRVWIGIYLGSSKVAEALTNSNGTYAARPKLYTPGRYRARTLSELSPPHAVEIRGAGAQQTLSFAGSVVERLRELGYAVPPPGHRSEGSVRQSVYAFQKAQGMTVDGVVGPETRAALADPEPVRPRQASGDHLEVDKGRQLLLVVRDGRIARIVNASTAGIPGYHTPEGRFRIFRRVEGLDTSPLGKLWNPLYFYRGWAIHGSTNVPPEPASHGCIRLPMWEAERLFDTVPHNQLVIIY